MEVQYFLLVLFSFAAVAFGDIYMHNPRGSNNRLNEKTATRQTNNRLFDSQNNNHGGYNVGDAGSEPANGNANLQYQMKYFQSSSAADSLLDVEATFQHGCGTSGEVDCNIILQYMCQDANTKDVDKFRDGTSTAIQGYSQVPQTSKETFAELKKRKISDVKLDRGLHENWNWYYKCQIRDRNSGLFTADQNLKKNSATSTRQNPNGNRNGYECPEERDYYPYWHPNPWKDIAVFTRQPYRCSKLQSESFNVKPRHECVEFKSTTRVVASRWNNQRDCEKHNGVWVSLLNYLEKAPELQNQESCLRRNYIWGLPYDGDAQTQECLVPLLKPDCKPAPWTRPNHNGNGRDGNAPHYAWKLPYFPSETNKTCVLRIRYNISTLDFDSGKTDFKFNGNKSPITNNPVVKVGSVALQLAINTQQTGRTFQDRSHVFYLMPRPKVLANHRIHNLNVRGKRGNIVQVYPAVEYDFAPTTLNMKTSDLVHIQWTGSNTHNNNKVGADGQGTAGTDRNNFMPITNSGYNYPTPFEKAEIWKNAKVKWIYHDKDNITALDLALNLASSGYYRCAEKSSCGNGEHKGYAYKSKPELNSLLNNAPASYPGVVLQLKKGNYLFMCSRNNNFSNRSQKGAIIVKA